VNLIKKVDINRLDILGFIVLVMIIIITDYTNDGIFEIYNNMEPNSSLYKLKISLLLKLIS
jgi:hypothetical protein